MEQPDANGFVNITWPSTNVPHGGLFHNRIAKISENNQEFLKVLLEESKLDIAHRSKSGWKLRQDEEEELHGISRQALTQKTSIRPRTSRRRSLSAIRESGVYEMDTFRPLKRGEDREQLKEKLAKLMAYGDVQDNLQTPPPSRFIKPKPKLPTAKEMKNELLTQIRERVDWLADMEYLGHADPHRDIIQDQIIQRLRSLDALGLDSQCSSARSKSGFSTTRSRNDVNEQQNNLTRKSTAKSVNSGSSDKSHKSLMSKSLKHKQKKEESIFEYKGFFTPLQYSPRRRV